MKTKSKLFALLTSLIVALVLCLGIGAVSTATNGIVTAKAAVNANTTWAIYQNDTDGTYTLYLGNEDDTTFGTITGMTQVPGAIGTFAYDEVFRGGMTTIPWTIVTDSGSNAIYPNIKEIVVQDPVYSTDLEGWFKGFSSLTSISGLDNFDGEIGYLGATFKDCSQLTSIDLSVLNIAQLNKMGSIFENCNSLTSVKFPTTAWGGSDFWYVDYAFSGCSSLQSVDLSTANFSPVNRFQYMFNGCSDLTSVTLPATTWGQEGALFSNMFYNCESLTTINNLDKLDISSAVYIEYMFAGASALTSIDLSWMNIPSGITMGNALAFGNGSLESITISASVAANFETLAGSTGFPIGNGWEDAGGNVYKTVAEIGAAGAGTYTKHTTCTYDNPVVDGNAISVNCSCGAAGASYSVTVPANPVYDGVTSHKGELTVTGSASAGVTAEMKYYKIEGGGRTATTETELVNPGEYEVDLTVGNGSVSQTVTYNISVAKADYDMSAVAWNYPSAFTYDGTAKTVELTGLPAGVTATYSGNTETNAGSYVASATFTYDTVNYNAPTFADLDWIINKADYDMSAVAWNYTAAFTYDGNAKTVELSGLPAGVTATYSGNTGTNAGSYTASATFTYDTVNYNAPTFADLDWIINKADYDMSAVAWNYTAAFTYDGTAKTVELTGLPAGVTATYSGNSGTNAGSYVASATFTYDTVNYNAPTFADLDWIINKADYDMTGVSWHYPSAFTYDGTAKTVTLKALPKGVDGVNATATYSGNTATNAGTYTASVAFTYDTVNYNAPTAIPNLSWVINKANYDMSAVAWNYTGPYTYKRAAYSVALTSMPKGVDGVNATATYGGTTSATDAGTYTASVTFTYDTVNYNKPTLADLTWKIDPRTVADATVTLLADLVYNKTEQTQTLKSVIVANMDLAEGVDYTVSGNKQTNAGNYELTVTGKGNFTGSLKVAWDIEKATLDMSNAKWDYVAPFVYDKTEKTVTVTGLPVEVTAQYTDNAKTNAGKYEAIADLIYDTLNYYPVSMDNLDWEILKARVEIPFVEIKVYNGETLTADVAEHELYTVTKNDGGINVGDYDVEITLNDYANYEWIGDEANETTVVIFTIMKAGNYWSNIFPANENYTYLGFKAPALTVRFGDLTAVFEGKSYPIADFFGSVAPNLGAGSYQVQYFAAGTENWEPIEQIVTYTVNKAKVANPVIGPTLYVYTGEQLTFKVAESELYTVTDHVGTEAGEYPVTVSLNDTDNYEWADGTTEDLIITFVIEKAVYDLTAVKWDYTAPFTYDGTEKTVSVTGLPEGVIAEYDGNAQTKAGSYVAHVTLVSNSANYNEIGTMTLNWTISKATLDMSSVAWSYTEAFAYDGAEKKVELTGLPAGVTATYENNAKTNAGAYTASATLSYDKENYATVSVPALSWSISKATLDMSEVAWNYTAAFTYDGTEKSVALTGLPEEISVTYTNGAKTNAGTYTAKAILSYDTVNYEAVSVADLRWTIARATFDMSNAKWNYTEAFTYDGTEKSVALTGLPEGVTAHYSNVRKTEVGEYVAKAALDYDKTNYNAISIGDLAWEIKKATYDMSGIKFESKTVIADGKAHSVVISGSLPAGVTVSYSAGSKTEPGVYTVKATFTYDAVNYNAIESMTATLTIKQAQLKSGNTAVVITENGIAPGVSLSVVSLGSRADAVFEGHLEKNQVISAAYDVSLLSGGEEIQPGEMLTIKLRIPAELKGEEFKVLHLHNGTELSELEYEIEGDYVIIKTDKLSEIAFVYETTSLVWLVIVLSVVSALLAGLLVFQIMRGRKSSAKANAVALPVLIGAFLVRGQVTASIVLGCIAGVLVLANVALLIIGLLKKKK